MLKIEYLQELLIISIVLSTITCTFIQKTKSIFKSSKYLSVYSLIINIIVGIVFCKTFTNLTLPNSLWVGFFSFIGADTIYKTQKVTISPFSFRNSSAGRCWEENCIGDNTAA